MMDTLIVKNLMRPHGSNISTVHPGFPEYESIGSHFFYQPEHECLASLTLRGMEAGYYNGILVGKRYDKF